MLVLWFSYLGCFFMPKVRLIYKSTDAQRRGNTSYDVRVYTPNIGKPIGLSLRFVCLQKKFERLLSVPKRGKYAVRSLDS